MTERGNWLCGMIADLPTPFRGDGGIDVVTFARLCERQVCAGASALVVGGCVGEGDMLTDDERAILIRTAIGIARGRLRIIAGPGSNHTACAIAQVRLAQAAGADAAISVVPYYNRPSDTGIAAHFRAILDATTLPLILHDAPMRCGRRLTDDIIDTLAEAPRVIGLRDDSGDLARLARLRSPIRLLSGHDATALAWLLSGGDGIVSALANVAPQLCRGLHVAVRKGCPRYAMTISDMLQPLAALLTPDQVTSVVKAALHRRGIGTPAVRLPRLPLDDAEQHLVEMALDAIWAQPEEAMNKKKGPEAFATGPW